MANVEIDTKGVEARLEQVPDVFARKAFAGVLRKSANVFKKEYKGRLPVKTGNLKNSITTKVFPPDARNNSFAAVVFPKRPKGNAANLIEHGHNVNRRGAKGDSARGKGLQPLTGSPRVEGKQHFLKAQAVVEPKIEQIVSDAIVKELDKIFKV